LKRENAQDLCVIKIPKDLKYVDYLVIMNGTSYRHMIGVAQFVRKCFKIKRHKNDLIPKIEGAESKEWIAMDLGNIALHIFTPKARRSYDLESLWLLGEEYEKKISSLRNKRNQELEAIYQNFNEMLIENPKTESEKSKSFE
jgi:ribosome silencing factor RsfS/YbeB/iojap